MCGYMRDIKKKKERQLLTSNLAFHGVVLVQDPLAVLEEKLGWVQHTFLNELDRRDHTLLRPLALCQCVYMYIYASRYKCELIERQSLP